MTKTATAIHLLAVGVMTLLLAGGCQNAPVSRLAGEWQGDVGMYLTISPKGVEDRSGGNDISPRKGMGERVQVRTDGSFDWSDTMYAFIGQEKLRRQGDEVTNTADEHQVCLRVLWARYTETSSHRAVEIIETREGRTSNLVFVEEMELQPDGRAIYRSAILGNLEDLPISLFEARPAILTRSPVQPDQEQTRRIPDGETGRPRRLDKEF